MSASDHIGEHIIRVYHSSRVAEPPHEVEPKYADDLRILKKAEGPKHAYNNVHPDIIHAGTYESAHEIGGGTRQFMHMYELDTREMSPVVYGDAPPLLGNETQKFKRRLSGEQQSLWESVPSTGLETLEHGKVQPYRNQAEDEGSISYMIPKSEIAEGRVKYIGHTKLRLTSNGTYE
jgi:hypothetical protein